VVKWRKLAIALGVLPLSLLACQLLVGIEERYATDAGPDIGSHDATPDVTLDAGHDAPPETTIADSGADTRNACPPGALPPPAPTTSSPTGADASFYVAVQSVWYDFDAGQGVTLGYDLDNQCTCPGPPSCVDDASRNCDDEGGRDLSGNLQLMAADLVLGRSVASLLNSKIASGQVTIILEVNDYNLGPDDQLVSISTFVGGGLLRPDAGPDSGFMPPVWNGTDVWSVDPRSALLVTEVDGGWVYTPYFFDTAAYVTNKTLVSQLPMVSLGFGTANLSLNDATLVASIETDITTDGLKLTGQFAGRVTVGTIFAIASTFPDPTVDAALCGDDAVFQTALRPLICHAADIMSLTTQDNMGMGCDALSVSLGFVARKILVGAPHEGLNPVMGCDGSVATCEGL
jgi:hypothetical protein